MLLIFLEKNYMLNGMFRFISNLKNLKSLYLNRSRVNETTCKSRRAVLIFMKMCFWIHLRQVYHNEY